MPRPHFAFPARLAGGRLVSVEQDSDEDIASCIGVILSYPLGARRSDPSFGIADESFSQSGPDLVEVRAAIVNNEPRADPIELTDEILEEAIAQVRVGFGSHEG